jgi:hypothetical protein
LDVAEELGHEKASVDNVRQMTSSDAAVAKEEVLATMVVSSSYRVQQSEITTLLD